MRTTLVPGHPYSASMASSPYSAARLLADARVRYLLCGSGVAMLYLGTFALLEVTARAWGYAVWFVIAQAVAISVAFPLYRTWVFASRGSLGSDALRFASVWGTSLLVSAMSLPLLVEVAGLDPVVAQLLAVVGAAGGSYLGHRFISFRHQHEQAHHP